MRLRCSFKFNQPTVYRDKWLDPPTSYIVKSGKKYEKEFFLRNLLDINQDVKSLFTPSETNNNKFNVSPTEINPTSKNERIQEALRIYNILRPNSPPPHKEESLNQLRSKLNQILLAQSPAFNTSPLLDSQDLNLPVLNPRAFELALETVTLSLSEDLEKFCKILDIVDLPAPNHPQRFRALVDRLFETFKLEKNPSAVDKWMFECWGKIRPFLPASLAELPSRSVGDWLKGHLIRVDQNRQKTPLNQHQKNVSESQPSWYDFGEDFIYDSMPLPQTLVDERNGEFPINKAGDYIQGLSRFLQTSRAGNGEFNEDTSVRFRRLLERLERLGLRSWLQLDIERIENGIPEGPAPQSRVSAEDERVARLILKGASRGMTDLSFGFDPINFFNDLPQDDQDLLPDTKDLIVEDKEIDKLFDLKRSVELLALRREMPSKCKDFLSLYGKTPIEEFVESERSTSGYPIVWEEDENSLKSWKWKVPTNSILDSKKGIYVRVREGIDSLLKMDRMRMTTLQFTQMNTMSSKGRISYYRVIVAVGDGRGLFGTGVGFGLNPNQARNDACNRALQTLDFIDLDNTSRILTTPVMGREYSTWVKIRGRAYGRGIKCNRRFLPLAYIMGLDNCFLTFGGKQKKWITRIRALRRALDGIQSRATIASATGQKIALNTAPADHWMHWPDRWFEVMAKNYEAKYRKLKVMRFRVAPRSKLREVLPEEVRPEWTPYTWKSPLQRWSNKLRQTSKIENNVSLSEGFESSKGLTEGSIHVTSLKP